MDENGFQDANGNKVIDAGERFDIHFTIRNEGQGDAYNLRLRLYEEQGYETFFENVSNRIRSRTEKIYKKLIFQ